MWFCSNEPDADAGQAFCLISSVAKVISVSLSVGFCGALEDADKESDTIYGKGSVNPVFRCYVRSSTF